MRSRAAVEGPSGGDPWSRLRGRGWGLIRPRRPNGAPGLLALLLALTAAATAHAAPLVPNGPRDIKHLCPSRAGGREWLCTWADGHARTFTGLDPGDPWFDADHGDGEYRVDGRGTLTASGDCVRMYVHDPAHRSEWGENLEITVYVTRLSETRPVSYSGLQIFARTNHGTVGKELDNLCDCRGYGAKVCLDGRWEFEKEIAHHLPRGYASAGTAHPWQALPRNQPVGVKYLIRNCDGGRHVRLELYRDLTDGANGGTWEKVAEATDTGANWGLGAGACKAGVKPELPLLHPLVRPDSESGFPMMTVYFRHEFATMRYSRASVREIDPLP